MARLRELPAAESFDAIRAHVTPRTRLLALSHVSWLDGRVLPWQELRAQTGVPVLVDGAQSVGAIAVDASGADFYTVSAQKWLCGPAATGALAVRDPEALPVRLVGYPSQEAYSIADATFEPKPGAARFDPGFAPAPSLAALEAALADPPFGSPRAGARAHRPVPRRARRGGPRCGHRGRAGDDCLVALARATRRPTWRASTSTAS